MRQGMARARTACAGARDRPLLPTSPERNRPRYVTQTFAFLRAMGLCPKKGVWNFEALKTPAFIEAGEFQTPFFWQRRNDSGKVAVARALNYFASPRRTTKRWPL